MTTSDRTGGHPLDAVFAPDCVAVVGASADPSKRGHQILRALQDGFRGTVLPVNPRGGEILGLPVHTSLDGLPQTPDLAVLCTPASSAPELVVRCGSAGIRAAVILAVGFAETGDDGRALEERVLAAANESGVRVVGPNTSGVLNLARGLNLVGVRNVRPGALSLLVQSGNMALAMMREATERSWTGIRICAGLGNARDVGFDESLDYLARDQGTRGVLCHMEGTARMTEFLDAASACVRRKPVVVLKAGRSDAGAAAARSHTGAVAGPYDRFRVALAQAGVTEVQRTDELLHVGETLAWQPPPPPGTGVALLCDGGGQGTLAADTLSEMGVSLARLSGGTRRDLSALLGPAAATANPVDIAGAADADPRVFAAALELLVRDPAVGGVLLVGLFGGYAVRFADALAPAEEEAARRMARVAEAEGRALIAHSMYALTRTAPLERLGTAHVPVVASLEVACRCVAELWSRSRRLAEPRWTPRPPGTSPREPGATHPSIRSAIRENRSILSEPESRRLMEDAGLPFPPARVCTDPAEAVEAAREWGPVALKIVSPGISHKSDMGGVVLGLDSPEAVADTFVDLLRRGRAHLERRGGGPGPEGILVTPMHPPPLVELLVGAELDPDLGFVVAVGAGGIWVEVVRDVALRALPVDEDAIRAMLGELRIGGILQGGRGRPPAHLDGVVRAVRSVARCVSEHAGVTEVEVNPLFVYPDRVVPVDARVCLESSGARTSPSV